MTRLLPFRGDDGIFDASFIEDRRKALEVFVNKLRVTDKSYKLVGIGKVFCNSSTQVAGHPLAQNEKSLHIFLQDATIDRNYTPGKVRAT